MAAFFKIIKFFPSSNFGLISQILKWIWMVNGIPGRFVFFHLLIYYLFWWIGFNYVLQIVASFNNLYQIFCRELQSCLSLMKPAFLLRLKKLSIHWRCVANLWFRHTLPFCLILFSSSLMGSRWLCISRFSLNNWIFTLLQEEEVRRNSVMFDMLFVTSSHPLSVSIYSLDNRCKQLAERERTEVKEKINPEHRFVSCQRSFVSEHINSIMMGIHIHIFPC